MDFIDSLNAISSQVWAGVLILLGLAAFALAGFCSPTDVRAALMSSGTGMIGGGIAMFQHQEKEANSTLPTPPTQQEKP